MFLDNPKLISLEGMQETRRDLRAQGRMLVMTNGCFDLLHTGHLSFLLAARKLGNRLLVALNSDASVRQLKGPARPVQSEVERSFALAALACVDHVLIFHEPNLVRQIDALQPDIYTKAGDYNLEKLHAGERAALERSGTRIQFLPYLAGFSTTSLIQKITQAGGIA